MKALTLLRDFMNKNYNQLNLKLDWKPCFNTLFAVLLDNELKVEFLALGDKDTNFFKLIEYLIIRLNKFFHEGSALEIFEHCKPHLSVENTKFLAYLFCFSVLIPTKRLNTNEDEVEEWLPFIVDLWKTCAFSSFYRSIFIRIFADVSMNFQKLDWTKHNEWIAYQFNLTVTKSGEGQGQNPYRQTHCERYFAQYFVNTFKSQEHIDIDAKMQTDDSGDYEFGSLMLLYRDYLHPSNKFKNKSGLVHFLKFLSTSL